MGYTIGDVTTVIGLVFGTLFAIWALLVCFGLLMPRKAEAARVEVQTRPWRAIGVGLLHNAILAVLAGAFAANPFPPAKLVGFGLYLLLLGTLAVGGSGIALLAAERIQQLEKRRGAYRALERGAMLLVVGALLPVFGWFGFAPIMLILAGGAGFRAIYARKPAPATRESTVSAAQSEFVV